MLTNVLFSESREVSIQRFVLAASVTSLAVLLPVLPPTQRSFNLCLGGAALVLLVLCHLGVLLAPQYPIHTALDITEPQLAGDCTSWPGSNVSRKSDPIADSLSQPQASRAFHIGT